MATERQRIQQLLPGYTVGQELGRGAFGIVYEATHKSLDRRGAVKALPRAFAADASLRERFLGEARLVASLDHPHIVPVYDFAEGDGVFVMVMEVLPGGSLWDRFTTQGLATDEACAVGLSICAALGYAHSRGVLHRDVKPENVMFSANGTPKLTDFGIAKLRDGDSRLTQEGMVIGTPAYMAPEQALGEQLTPAADVYSTGVLLYELLSGVLPFSRPGDTDTASSSVAMMLRHVNEDAIPLLDVAPHVPTGIAAVVMRALSRSTTERYESAESFGAALGAACANAFGTGWLARSGVPVTGSTVIIAAAQRPAPGGSPTKLVKALVTQAPAATESLSKPAPVAEHDTKPAARRGVLVASIAAVVLLAVAGTAIAFLMRDTPPTESTVAAVASTTLPPGTTIAQPPSFSSAEVPYRDACKSRTLFLSSSEDPDLRCRCVLDVLQQLEGAKFFTQAFLDDFKKPGALNANETKAKLSCVAQGR